MSMVHRPGSAPRREQISALLHEYGRDGATWKEIAAATGMHHGSVSSALSLLHSSGEIACLHERRDRCYVYVVLEQVDGRPLRAPGRRRGVTAAQQEAAAWQAGRNSGEDVGWQIGYDTAMAEVAARPEVDVSTVRSEAFSNGITQGRIREATDLMRLVAEMRMTIRRQNRVLAHSKTCWMEHPDCALQSVEKALAKTVPVPPRREPAA